MARTWLEVGREFSIWNHLSGISLNWVLTLDLFFLGYFLFGAERARTLGLYAVGLKFANFTGTLPQAFNSIFQVWLGRRHAGDPDGIARERREVLRAGGILFLGSALQAGAFMALAPFAVRLFSRGRWDGADQALIVPWMRWIVAGSALYSGTLLLSSWIMMRGRQKDAFFRLYLPYLGAAAAIYGGAAFWGGPEGAARANIAVSAVFVAMAWRYASRSLVAPGQAAKR